MNHITEYYNRSVANYDYKKFRQTWDRYASLWLTQMRHCKDPSKRLSSALTLCKCRVPLTGIYQHQDVEFNDNDIAHYTNNCMTKD